MFNQKINFFDTDSYKISHHKQYPPGTTHAYSYIESRGSNSDSKEVMFFGLQHILQQLEVPSMYEIDEARNICNDHFGSDDVFNYEGWKSINKLGYIPLKVSAVPEGTVVPCKNVLAVVENTESGFAWLVSWFETQLLRVWYPCSVATLSYEIKQIISGFLEMNGTPEIIGFKLHDFGSRGASSSETAAIGGMAHLVNFLGTDTILAIQAARRVYSATGNDVGFSIPASEHSTITSWGEKGEIDAFENMIDQFGGEGKIYACVSDSYDIWKALRKWESLEKKILAKGGTLVIRPDSGDPIETPIKVVEQLCLIFGYSFNDKGYRVLPDHIRVIQGDGINKGSINKILKGLNELGISSDNIAFGMGGALLQAHGRDDYKFAMKTSAVKVNGEWQDVFKDPITDPGKKSKKGRVILCSAKEGEFYSSVENDVDDEFNVLRTVFHNGTTNLLTFDEVRKNASK